MARLTRILFRCRFHWAGIAAIVNRQGILSRSESWGRLGALSGRLGRLWRHLGALLGRLGALSEASWAVLERTLGPIGPSWSVEKLKKARTRKHFKYLRKLNDCCLFGPSFFSQLKNPLTRVVLSRTAAP